MRATRARGASARRVMRDDECLMPRVMRAERRYGAASIAAGAAIAFSRRAFDVYD